MISQLSSDSFHCLALSYCKVNLFMWLLLCKFSIYNLLVSQTLNSHGNKSANTSEINFSQTFLNCISGVFGWDFNFITSKVFVTCVLQFVVM